MSTPDTINNFGLTPDELEELRKADPSAFDEDDAPEAIADDKPEDKPEDKAEDKTPEEDPPKDETKAEDDEPEKAESRQPMIPKARFDEVNSENKEIKARLAALEAAKAQEDAAKADPPRDFKGELKALMKAYSDGDIDQEEPLDKQT